jgi:hypothetical protein
LGVESDGVVVVVVVVVVVAGAVLVFVELSDVVVDVMPIAVISLGCATAPSPHATDGASSISAAPSATVDATIFHLDRCTRAERRRSPPADTRVMAGPAYRSNACLTDET